MRNSLMIRSMKGSAINPKTKFLAGKPLGRRHPVKSAVRDLGHRLNDLHIHRGVGMEVKPARPVRKPLKFTM